MGAVVSHKLAQPDDRATPDVSAGTKVGHKVRVVQRHPAKRSRSHAVAFKERLDLAKNVVLLDHELTIVG